MATSVSGSITAKVVLTESVAGDLSTPTATHIWDASASRATGSGSSQTRLVYSDTNSVASGVPVTYDLAAVLIGLDAAAQTYAPVVGFAIRNKSTTTSQNLQIGAGSNPFITWLGATGDVVVVGPGGFFMLESPIDGYAVTPSTGDILTISSSSGTISFDFVIWGR